MPRTPPDPTQTPAGDPTPARPPPEALPSDRRDDELDDLDELPPIDGDGGEEQSADDSADVDDLEDGGDAFDDATAEDEPVDPREMELEEGGASWLGEATDSDDLDVGEGIMLDVAGTVDERDDEPAGTDGAYEDYDLEGADDPVALDGGDEGPLDPDEELRDADLPSLDADDEREADDASFWESRPLGEEPLGFSWSSHPWTRVGAPLALEQAAAITCVARGALVAAPGEGGGGDLVRIDLEGAIEPLEIAGIDAQEVVALSADDRQIAVVKASGDLLVGPLSGGAFAAACRGVPVADAIAAGGALWIRTHAGALLVSADGGREITRCPVPGVVAAIGRDGSDRMAALVVGDAGAPITLMRGRVDGTVGREPIEAPAPAHLPAIFAARSGPVAYASKRGDVVRRSVDGIWRSFDWDGKILAMTFVDDAGTLLVATHSEADDVTALVRLGAAAPPEIVARLGPSDPPGEGEKPAVALAYDDSRGVVWVAGRFGIAAFAMSAA